MNSDGRVKEAESLRVKDTRKSSCELKVPRRAANSGREPYCFPASLSHVMRPGCLHYPPARTLSTYLRILLFLRPPLSGSHFEPCGAQRKIERGPCKSAARESKEQLYISDAEMTFGFRISMSSIANPGHHQFSPVPTHSLLWICTQTFLYM